MSAAATKQLFIRSTQGNLEAELDLAENNEAIAVLCHPHPLYGGTMHDSIIQIAAECAQSVGISSLRFNFRGVGASAGRHQPAASKPEETEDLIAVLDWAKSHASHQKIVAIGYSFGASVVSHLLDHPSMDYGVLIAPPNAVMNCHTHSGSKSLEVIYGSLDDYVDAAAYKNVDHVLLHEIAQADHFFSGAHDILANTLSKVLESL